MPKVRVVAEKLYRVLGAGPICVLTIEEEDKFTATPVAWMMPCSFDPPMVAVAVAPERFFFEIFNSQLKKRGVARWVINVPAPDHLELVMKLGSKSGKVFDKSKLLSLERVEVKTASDNAKFPIISDFPINVAVESKTQNFFKTGDHLIISGSILTGWAERGTLDNVGIVYPDNLKLPHHAGSNKFLISTNLIEA